MRRAQEPPAVHATVLATRNLSARQRARPIARSLPDRRPARARGAARATPTTGARARFQHSPMRPGGADRQTG